MRFQTRQAALAQIQKDIASGKLSAEDVARLKGQMAALQAEEVQRGWTTEHRRYTKEALEQKYGREFSDEEMNQILGGTHETISLNEATHETSVLMKARGVLDEKNQGGESGEGVLSTIGSAITGTIDSLFLNRYSNEAGYVDPETGEWRSSTCFTRNHWISVSENTAGAFVHNGKHYKFIQDIRKGDEVWSYNEKTKELQLSRVSQTFVRQTDRIYTLVYDSGTKIETTGDHPFFIERDGWRDARDLRAGDDSLLAREVSPFDIFGGVRITPVSWNQQPGGVIVSVSSERRNETVYNFEVEGTHTYLVTEDGVVVHNAPWQQYAVDLIAFEQQGADFRGCDEPVPEKSLDLQIDRGGAGRL